MKEIVGAIIGTVITNDKNAIMAGIQAGTIKEFLDRRRMQLMAACDLGLQWENMANSPTLFCVDDKGVAHPREAARKVSHDA